MKTYGEFAPTLFDPKGLGLDDQQHWLVHPCTRNRDSGILDESNFHVALEDLGGESDAVEVHRFGHWANGWFEIILIDPSFSSIVAKAEGHYAALENYPLLSDDDHSRREWDAVNECWERMDLRDRIHLCAENDVSWFAARHDWIPDDDADPNMRVFQALVRWVNGS